MTPPPVGTPWWAWLLAVLAVAAFTALASIVTAHVTNRPVKRRLDVANAQLESVAADAAEARAQTANTHDTNLREDLDEKFDAVLAVVGRIEVEQKEQRRDIGGLRADHRAVRDDLGRISDRVDANFEEQRRQHDATAARLDAHAEKLDEHLHPEP